MNTHTYIHWIRPRFSLSLSLRIHLHPSSSSSTITRPKFTSDPTIIFHGFAEWLWSFRNKNPRSLAANHDFRNFKGFCSTKKDLDELLFFIIIVFFFTHWYSCLRCVDWRRWKRGFFNRRVNIPSLAKHPFRSTFALDVSLKLDARGTDKKLRQ